MKIWEVVVIYVSLNSNEKQKSFFNDTFNRWSVLKCQVNLAQVKPISQLHIKIQFFCSLSLAKIIRCHQEFGEIYSLALDKNYLLTGHTLTTTCVQVWNISGDDLLPCSTMREYSSESIIWNIHLGGSFKIWNRYNSKF